jgi:hypothetical protein
MANWVFSILVVVLGALALLLFLWGMISGLRSAGRKGAKCPRCGAPRAGEYCGHCGMKLP